MAEYVLDTHACLFALSAPKKLGERARKALRRVEQGREQAWVPAAVVAEVVMLHELRRTDIGLSELRETFDVAPGFAFLPMDLDQLDHFSAHGSIRDPFDRLIVAAARSVGAKLITKDERIIELRVVPTLW